MKQYGLLICSGEVREIDEEYFTSSNEVEGTPYSTITQMKREVQTELIEAIQNAQNIRIAGQKIIGSTQGGLYITSTTGLYTYISQDPKQALFLAVTPEAKTEVDKIKETVVEFAQTGGPEGKLEKILMGRTKRTKGEE